MSNYKDVVIRVKSTENLSKAESGSVLLFDRNTNCYYLVGPSELLKSTRKMVEEAEAKAQAALVIQEETKKKEDEFEKRIIQEFNNFSSNIKTANSSLIDLVNQVVNKTTEGK